MPSSSVLHLTELTPQIVYSFEADGVTKLRGALPVSSQQIELLLIDHRNELGSSPAAHDAISSADILLHRTAALLGGVLNFSARHSNRLELRIEGDNLELLPIEAAAEPGKAAPFEITLCYRRQVSTKERTGLLPLRHFRAESLASNYDRDPYSAAIERELAEAIIGNLNQRSKPEHENVERLILFSGHDPRADDVTLEPSERAHLILSGCSSLPRDLPAGAASATGTLWPVEDTDTAVFSLTVLSRILRGISPAESLRQAQILHRTSPSRVWAAFSHIGDPD